MYLMARILLALGIACSCYCVAIVFVLKWPASAVVFFVATIAKGLSS